MFEEFSYEINVPSFTTIIIPNWILDLSAALMVKSFQKREKCKSALRWKLYVYAREWQKWDWAELHTKLYLSYHKHRLAVCSICRKIGALEINFQSNHFQISVVIGIWNIRLFKLVNINLRPTICARCIDAWFSVIVPHVSYVDAFFIPWWITWADGHGFPVNLLYWDIQSVGMYERSMFQIVGIYWVLCVTVTPHPVSF